MSTEVRTLCSWFEETASAFADEVALRTLDGPERTWAQTRDEVHRLAGGLRAMGVQRGVTVATMVANRPEFFLADMAVLYAGGTPMSIYATSPVDEIAYLLDDADIRVIVHEERFGELLRSAIAKAEADPQLVALTPSGSEGLQPILDLCPPDFDGGAAGREVELTDIAVIVYTSGTTGPPKGVQLTHRNLGATWRAARSLDPRLDARGRVISYLPTAHIADRLWGYLIGIRTGTTITYIDDPKQVLTALVAVHPTFFLGVPRIWEKLRVALQAAVPEGRSETEPEIAQMLCAKIGMSAEETVAFTGAAPLDAEVLDFFDRIGIPLLEGYGMTETSGVISSNRIVRKKAGTVGYAFDGVEFKLADDGEILVRGDDVQMLGYRNKPEKTAETIGEDGWLRTGDVGTIDEDGMLTIIDRKKEVIITSGGKNISPANVENAIRSATHLAGPVMAVGDRRGYVTAIISLDPDESKAWAAREGVDGDLASNPALRDTIAAAIEEANQTLTRAAQVKRFVIVPETWDAASGLVTPTLKLKRRAAVEHYADAIEKLYAD